MEKPQQENDRKHVPVGNQPIVVCFVDIFFSSTVQASGGMRESANNFYVLTELFIVSYGNEGALRVGGAQNVATIEYVGMGRAPGGDAFDIVRREQ